MKSKKIMKNSHKKLIVMKIKGQFKRRIARLIHKKMMILKIDHKTSKQREVTVRSKSNRQRVVEVLYVCV